MHKTRNLSVMFKLMLRGRDRAHSKERWQKAKMWSKIKSQLTFLIRSLVIQRSPESTVVHGFEIRT